jgi:hypothetical protein
MTTGKKAASHAVKVLCDPQCDRSRKPAVASDLALAKLGQGQGDPAQK